MFKTIVDTILKTAEAPSEMRKPRGLARDELLALFRDDFAAQAELIRARKARCGAVMKLAA